MRRLEPLYPAPCVDTPQAEAILLSDAFESGEAARPAHALGIVARARGLAPIARAAGIGRPTLSTAIDGTSAPKFSARLALTRALDIKVGVEPKSREVAV
ncbi:addiction module antidote protein [Amaricoccus solimangrovi]|uniref:Putative addiction module antidote protein n=1 Tax=Amaricoccus solimangrovi TaxID=2589815 RepID=A0A501WYU3_9RHOB|nr:addiction module antidote protein [Amaricoccus solimangrovi]TPE53474.1 putative addiction module antidote protein [Amaricoccus solimangrovi]